MDKLVYKLKNISKFRALNEQHPGYEKYGPYGFLRTANKLISVRYSTQPFNK